MTQWFIGNLRTGTITNYLPVSSGSWEIEVNAAGSIRVTLPINDPDVQAINLRNTATVGKTFLGVAENGVILNAGPVWTHTYNRDDGKLELGATGLWGYYDYRSILPLLKSTDTDPTGLDTDYLGLGAGTVAKRLVQQAQQENGGTLPVVFQDDVAGTVEYSYEGAALTTVSDALNDLTAVVDIDFMPRFTSDGSGVEWVLRTGTEAVPQLSSQTVQTWDLSVPKPTVKGLQVAVSGTKLAGRVWETGSSAYARYDNTSLIGQGYPLLEQIDGTHNDELDPVVLAGYARDAARVGTKPTELWSFQAQADAQPFIGAYRPGDWCVVKIGDDPYIARGPYSRRITNMSGDQDGRWVSITTGEAYSLTG